MIQPIRQWVCDGCRAVSLQTGPAALELLPTPPVGWAVVETTRVLPSRVTGEGVNKVKVGASREVKREAFCGFCVETRSL